MFQEERGPRPSPRGQAQEGKGGGSQDVGDQSHRGARHHESEERRSRMEAETRGEERTSQRTKLAYFEKPEEEKEKEKEEGREGGLRKRERKKQGERRQRKGKGQRQGQGGGRKEKLLREGVQGGTEYEPPKGGESREELGELPRQGVEEERQDHRQRRKTADETEKLLKVGGQDLAEIQEFAESRFKPGRSSDGLSGAAALRGSDEKGSKEAAGGEKTPSKIEEAS